jgi:hypothetical protein
MSTYRDHPALSQSHLKLLATQPDQFFTQLERSKTPKTHFHLGTAVDICVLEGQEALMDRVKVIKESTNGLMYRVCEELINNDLEPIDENILAIRDRLDVFPTWNASTVVRKFNEENLWYYELLKNIQPEDIVLNKAALENALTISNSLTTNPRTAPFFEQKENCLLLHHVDMYFTHLGVECKGEIDLLELDFRNKTIQPYDVKTTRKATRHFASSVKDYRYDIQAACYAIGLLAIISGHGSSPKLDDFDLSDYIVLPPMFLVESTDPKYIGIAPMPFRASNEMLKAGRYGVYPDKRFTVTGPGDRMLFANVPLIPGYDNLIEDYKWYQTRPQEDRVYLRIELEQMDSTGAVILSPW